MSKYTVKSGDYLFKNNKNLTDEVVLTLELSLQGRWLFAFGGFLKQIYRQLKENKKIEDAESEEADLVRVSDELQVCMCPICDLTLLEGIYRWLPEWGLYYKSDNDFC
jgi:hypothetical protein